LPAVRHGARLCLKSPTVRTAKVLIGAFSGGDHKGASPRVNCREPPPGTPERLPIRDTALFATEGGSIYIVFVALRRFEKKMAEPKAPAKPAQREVAPQPPSRTEIDPFLKDVRSLKPAGEGSGRLIFAMDATMSRQPSWDLALELQADMFRAVKAVGGLDVQLVYFRGFNECQASKWVGDPDALAALMRKVACAGGFTQIGRVL